MLEQTAILTWPHDSLLAQIRDHKLNLCPALYHPNARGPLLSRRALHSPHSFFNPPILPYVLLKKLYVQVTVAIIPAQKNLFGFLIWSEKCSIPASAIGNAASHSRALEGENSTNISHKADKMGEGDDSLY